MEPVPTNPILASGENGIIKTHKELLVDAEKKIGELENQIRRGTQENEVLKWQNAQLRVAVTALGSHYRCPPPKAKKIIDAYIERQEKEFKKATDDAKKKFLQDLKDGKVPQFQTVPNPDAPKKD